MSGGRGSGWVVVPQPAGSFPAPPDFDKEARWTTFDDSVNAVSFGFVATAILISMFLLMAIFEKFLRARSASSRTLLMDIESPGRIEYNGKLEYPSPKATVYAKEVSVVMPGDEIPTFIAHPAPPPLPPCPREGISRPLHNHHRRPYLDPGLSTLVQSQTR